MAAWAWKITKQPAWVCDLFILWRLLQTDDSLNTTKAVIIVKKHFIFLFDEGYYTQESRLATLSGLWKCTRVNAALTTVHILILVRFTYWQGLHGQIWWEYLQKFIYSMTVTRIWKESPVISMRLDWGTIN